MASERTWPLNPGKASAHGDYACFLVTCPDPQFRDAAEALAHAQKAVALDPANADFAAVLGMAQYRSRRMAGGRRHAGESHRTAPGPLSGPRPAVLVHGSPPAGPRHRRAPLLQTSLGRNRGRRSTEELRQLRTETATFLGIRESAEGSGVFSESSSRKRPPESPLPIAERFARDFTT